MPTAVSAQFLSTCPFFYLTICQQIVTPCLGSFLACVNTLSCSYQQPSRGINPAGDLSIIRAQVLIVLSAKGISHHSRCNQMKLDLLTFAANFQPQIGGIGLLLHSCSQIPQGKTHGMCNTPGGKELGVRIDRPRIPRWCESLRKVGLEERKYEKYKIPYYQANENVPPASFQFGFFKENYTNFAFASLSTCYLSEIYKVEVLGNTALCDLRLYLNKLLLQGRGISSFLWRIFFLGEGNRKHCASAQRLPGILQGLPLKSALPFFPEIFIF